MIGETGLTPSGGGPAPWTLVQAWRNLGQKDPHGHTFIIVAQRNQAVLTLEANFSFRLDGVGFRGLGNAERFNFTPPSGWSDTPGLWEDGTIWTWPRIQGTYRDLKLARLKVTHLQWVP